MNPYIKNCRTGCHDDILNRTSHYCKLLNTRSTIDNRHRDNYLSLLSQNSKKSEQSRRLSSNLKIMKSIFEIERKQSRYLPEGESEDRRRSLKNSYLERQKQLSISEDNVRLFKKIVKVDSDVSQQKMDQFNSKITRYARLITNPVRHITEMDNQFFDTYRHQLFKAKISPGKSMNETEHTNEKNHQMKQARRKRNKKLKLRKIGCEQVTLAQDNNPESEKK